MEATYWIITIVVIAAVILYTLQRKRRARE
jgi:hypothetical protein